MHSGFTVGATWQPSFVDTAHTPAKASEGKQLAHSCYAVVSDAQNCVAATGLEPTMFCAANARSITAPPRPSYLSHVACKLLGGAIKYGLLLD